MDKRGNESIPVSYLWLVYIVLTVIILTTLVVNTKDRVTGDEYSNIYTANTVAVFYDIVNSINGNMEIQFTSSKPYTLQIQDNSVSVLKEESENRGESIIIEDEYLIHKDTGLFVNNTIKIIKEGDEISVR